MQLLSFRKPYEMLPPVPEAQMLTHGFAYQHGTFLRDIGVDDIDPCPDARRHVCMGRPA